MFIQTGTCSSYSEVVVIRIGKRVGLSLCEFLVHSGDLVLVDLDLCWLNQGSLNELQVSVVDHAAEEPDEWLLELVVALGRDIVVLKVLLAMESDHLGLDLTIANVDLVSDEDDGNGLANTGQVLVPLGYVGVGDARAHIEHDDTALATDIVSVTETTELLLTGSVPNVENDLAVAGVEGHGVDLNTESGDVFLFELTGLVALDEGGLTDTTITDEDELEFRDLSWSVNHFSVERKSHWVNNLFV